MYSKKVFESHLRRHYKKEKYYEELRIMNDHAYFLYVFTRLEGKIRELSDKLINKKVSALKDWKQNRVWDVIKKQSSEDKLSFLFRVSLLTPKDRNYYCLIKKYYDQRNKIAHGGNFTIVIDVGIVLNEIKSLFRCLKI